MNLQDLGNVGEFVASIATLATLAYLALQIRQNVRSNQLAALTRVAESVEEWTDRLLQDPVLEEIWRRGMRDPEGLSAEERGRFDLVMFRELKGIESGWLQLQWGIVDPDHWQGFAESIRFHVGSRGGRQSFERNRRFLSPRFASAVEQLCDGDD